jgi:hypothetical protein
VSFARPIKTFAMKQPGMLSFFTYTIVLGENEVEFWMKGFGDIFINGVRPHGLYTRKSYDNLMRYLAPTSKERTE